MPSTVTTYCPIYCHAQARPEALALWTPGRRWTYAELDTAVEATRKQLQEAGVESGARVALILRRCPEMVVLLWALWRQGAVAVPISTRWPIDEAEAAVQSLGCPVLIAEGDTIESVEASIVSRPESFVTEPGKRGTSQPSPRPLGRPATIVFTSGSTGMPKAALHTWANHVYSAKGSNANIPLRAGDRWLLSLPLYHVGGLAILVRCALAGAAVALPDREAELSTALDASGATHVSLVATQLRRLLDTTEGAVPGCLRAVLLGGGPLPESLLRRGDARDWPLHTSYGSTEMASQVTTTPPGALLDELLTAGRPLPHRRLRIDEDDQILVRGPTLFRGYVEAEGLRNPRTEEGWYPTGDLGMLDARGCLRVRGRTDHMFVSGGENIQPEEIEAALERCVDIERAVVVPVPDAEYGARPVAFVQAEHGLQTAGWEAHLEESLPRFKIPDAFYRLPDAPTSGRMKINREALQQRARQLRTR